MTRLVHELVSELEFAHLIIFCDLLNVDHTYILTDYCFEICLSKIVKISVDFSRKIWNKKNNRGRKGTRGNEKDKSY